MNISALIYEADARSPGMLHNVLARLLGGVLCILLAGCSSTAIVEKPVGVEATEAASRESLGQEAQQVSSPPKADDRYRQYPGTGILVKSASLAPSVKEAAGGITLNFEGADLREVVRAILGDILKENYIVDPRVGGSITLRTAQPIPLGAALHTLEEVLRMNGAVLIREADGVFRIVPVVAAGKGNVTPQLGEVSRPLPGGYSIQLVPLKYIGVADMARMLEPLAGEPSSVRVDPLRNMLILAGTELQLRHMLETIEMFDVDWISGMSVGLFTLKNVEAKTVVGEFEKVLGDKTPNPLAGVLRIVPIERLNALLVVTPQPKYLEQARIWVERLDRSGGGAGGGKRLYIYSVQNGKAEELAALLNDAFSRDRTTRKEAAPSLAPGVKGLEVSTTGTATTDIQISRKPADKDGSITAGNMTASADGVAVPREVRVIADKANNALLILSNPADYESIEVAIRKLDVVPRQVLVEVTIAEITLKDELKYGLEWYFTNGARISGQLDIGASGIASLTPGLSYVWKNKAGNINAVLNALANDSKLKVISSPHVTVADNQIAKIEVGNRVPTIGQTQTVAASTSTTGIISTVQYVETGVMLKVKPHINAGGLVSMDISQEVSNAIPTTTSGIDSPTIQKRAAESSVTIQSGDTLILGGLISEETSRSSEGLPILSRMPILGGLFGTEDRSDNRTELIVLITPRVMDNGRQATEITNEYRARLSGLQNLMKSTGIGLGSSATLKLDSSLGRSSPLP